MQPQEHLLKTWVAGVVASSLGSSCTQCSTYLFWCSCKFFHHHHHFKYSSLSSIFHQMQNPLEKTQGKLNPHHSGHTPQRTEFHMIKPFSSILEMKIVLMWDPSSTFVVKPQRWIEKLSVVLTDDLLQKWM